MKIAFFEIKEEDKKFFQDKFASRAELIFFDNPLDDTTLTQIADVDGLVVFIYSILKKDRLDTMQNLKFITTMSTGFDHIDYEECKKRNIFVCNVPAYAEVTVAEHTFALLLALSRNIIPSYKRVREEEKFSPEGLTGFDLAGKTLGVIGVGSIGKNVIKIARGFAMNVVAFKRTRDAEMARELGFSFVDLPTLLSTSDIVSLHIPYNKDNHHFMDRDKFDQMKQGSILINTARGGLIDTGALLAALESGKIAGAGLDVIEEEPLLREEHELLSHHFNQEQLENILESHMLVKNPKVLVTPHNAFNSHEALKRILEVTATNIDAFLGEHPTNIVV